jgi:hypothetical protein
MLIYARSQVLQALHRQLTSCWPGLAEGADPGSDDEGIMLIPSYSQTLGNGIPTSGYLLGLRVSHRYRAVPTMLRKREADISPAVPSSPQIPVPAT